MLKVMTILGTRPEIIKMSRVIFELEKYFDHKLVHTGQNSDYELNQVFFNDLEIKKPDFFLKTQNTNPIKTVTCVIEKVDELIKKEKPDAILLYGDTNSCLAVIAAKRNKVPIFHMEAGNRCFDQRVPEEINRKIVDHLSDINLVLSEHARRYLIAEGINPETIIKTGSHMNEVINHYGDKIKSSNVLKKLKLKNNNFFLVSAHREENVDNQINLKDLIESLNYLASEYKYPIIFSTHPRTKKMLDKIKDIKINKLIKFMKPLGFFDYMKLQMNAYCIISDSGTITEESSILNLPAITIRNTHERPEGMDEGTLIMSGLKKNDVLNSVQIIANQFIEKKQTLEVQDYKSINISTKIIRIIRSYTHYVNRTVWHK
tara:strand:- start:11710 stop:12831 length:1122 start_codon:yes stop_codon:yes gene_type:complete